MRRVIAWGAGVVLAITAAVLVAAWLLLRASLPPLDGELEVPGLAAPVSIERDANGVVTVEGRTRADVAYGLGHAHGQDRFFQMDLARRLAAGELAELFGPLALEQDRRARVFRFRRVARAVLGNATRDERAAIDAYARGVNDGFATLRSRPWEYWLLRVVPEPWRDEDTVLAIHAMWWQLQYGGFAADERRQDVEQALRERVDDASAAEVLAFLFPERTEWDAPNGVAERPETRAARPVETPGAPTAETPRVPRAETWDPRRSTRSESAGRGFPFWASNAEDEQALERARAIGSNNWAVAGTHTASGAALVANDMHLGLDVPAIWYRARLRVLDEDLELNGVTLPGAPALVAGSNGHIAWGYTNSYGDWLDVRWTRCDLAAPSFVDLQGEASALERTVARLRVKGERGRLPFEVLRGSEGVVLATRQRDGHTECRIGNWLAMQPAATNLRLLAFERARNVDDALAVAHEVGIPHQNVVIGDRAGRIAWTVLGRVPASSGPLRATSSVFLDAATHPKLVDPESGRLWTANARPIDGPAAMLIGDDEARHGAGYDLGARAGQIRDGLFGLTEPADAAAMLRVQLDDRALFLERWRVLLLDLLDEASLSAGADPQRHAARAQFRELIADGSMRASADSVSYRLVREFRTRMSRALWAATLESLELPAGKHAVPPQFEAPLWALVTERPTHWLPQGAEDWRAFLVAGIDATIDALRSECTALAECTWGTREVVRMRHPLSRAVPFVSRWIDMPPLALAGDHDVPRVQGGDFGASERFAISPGQESSAYLQLPGGQSAHPLSPFYRSLFDDWASGSPTPLLPGPAHHKLVLSP